MMSNRRWKSVWYVSVTCLLATLVWMVSPGLPRQPLPLSADNTTFIDISVLVDLDPFQGLYRVDSGSASNASAMQQSRNTSTSVGPVHVRSDEIQHAVFVKVHKAASSTVMSILLRYALSRQLNVMLPFAGNILSNRSPMMGAVIEHPQSPPFLFDILCNHVIFDIEQIRPFFPADTRYVAILREPWELIQSAYHYFKEVEHMDYLGVIPSFGEYLSSPLKYEPRDLLNSFTMNRMSTDMGLPQKQMWNTSYAATFIEHLDKIFHLVLIAERFNESMVLLKRLLRWRIQDVLYVKINTHAHNTTKVAVTNIDLRSRIEHLNHHDVAIYGHFLSVFQQKVDAEGPSFKEEVENYSKLLDKLAEFCIPQKQGKVTFEATKWNSEFGLDAVGCGLITMTELPLVDLASREQRKRMRRLYGSDQVS